MLTVIEQNTYEAIERNLPKIKEAMEGIRKELEVSNYLKTCELRKMSPIQQDIEDIRNRK